MKLKSGDLITPGEIAPDVVELYDREPNLFPKDGLGVIGYIAKGEVGLVLSSNNSSTIVCVLGTQGFGFTFGSILTKVDKR